MKPALYVLVVCALVAVAHSARASPRKTSQEDALADGEIDPEDIATRTHPILGAPSGSAWISLLAFARRTLDEQREVGGFVVLGLPLDRFARANTRLSQGAPELERAANVETTIDVGMSTRFARACVAAAWRASGLGADDARLDAIISRARWSAALPEARLRAVRFEDARLSMDTGTDTSRLRDSAGANVGFEARLTWRLDRLVYADDEPAFERMRFEQRDARTRIGAKVLEALFHWQRAVLDLRTLPPSQQGTRDEADVKLRVLEAEATLDVLTSGWFGTQQRSAPRHVTDL